MRDMGCGVLRVAMGEDTDRKENKSGVRKSFAFYISLVCVAIFVCCLLLSAMQDKTRLQGRNRAAQNQTLTSALYLLKGRRRGMEGDRPALILQFVYIRE